MQLVDLPQHLVERTNYLIIIHTVNPNQWHPQLLLAVDD